MKVLITGCTGFLGGSIGQVAARNGFEILGIGRSPRPAPCWRGKYVQEDVAHCDLSGIIDDFMPDALFHAAGPGSVRRSFDTPVEDFTASLVTWVHVLDSIRRSNVRPIVLFPSSAAVYGDPVQLPVREDAAIAPISPYGFHKAACELVGREYADCFNLDVIVCRFFSLFGAAQRRLLIWDLYQRLSGPERTVWLEGGCESRDYLDIADAGAIVLRLIQRPYDRKETHCHEGSIQVINIGRGEQIRVADLAHHMRDLIAPNKDIRFRNKTMIGDPRSWCADISLLCSLFPDWRPTPFSTALARCVAAWQKRG